MISGINTELTAEEAIKKIKDLFPVIAKAAYDEKRRLNDIKKKTEEKFRLAQFKDRDAD
jgi:hypothetical protein